MNTDDTVELLQREMLVIHAKVEALQAWVTDNAEVTRDVRDLLASFRVSGNIAKWIATMLALVAGGFAVAKGWLNK